MLAETRVEVVRERGCWALQPNLRALIDMPVTRQQVEDFLYAEAGLLDADPLQISASERTETPSVDQSSRPLASLCAAK